MTIYRTFALLAALTLAVIGSFVAAQQTTNVETEVRINARELEDGRVDFALQQRDGDGWGERILPRVRKFPAEVDHTRWLFSSVLTVDDQNVRIAARRLEDGRTEFGLQVNLNDNLDRPNWSEVLFPRSRFFPPDSEVDRWLSSSPLVLDGDYAPIDPVPPGVPISVETFVTLASADLDGWAYNGLEPSFYYGTDVEPLTDHVRTWINKVARTNDDLYDTMRLQIACENDGSISTIVWEESLPFVSGSSVSVSWRIDGGDVVTERWSHWSSSDDGAAASDRFARALPSADTVVVQITFYSRTLTTTFTKVRDMFRTRVQPNIEYCGRY